jgi:hypothetical protein
MKMERSVPGQSFQVATAIETASTVAARAANATGTESVFITDIVITIYAHADTGTLALNDGTTSYFMWLCKDGNGHTINIHFDQPFYWGQNKKIDFINATAYVKANLVIKGFTNIKA